MGYLITSVIYHFSFVSVNDTLDDILTESGDEEEQDAIVTQVLDEIGIDISGKVKYTFIWTLSQENLSSWFATRSCSNQPTQLQRLARMLESLNVTTYTL